MNGAFLNPSPCSADMLPRCLAERTGENKANAILVDHESKIRWSPVTRLGVVHGYSVTEVKTDMGVMAGESGRQCTNLSIRTRMVQSTGAVLWSELVPPHSDEGYLQNMEKLDISSLFYRPRRRRKCCPPPMQPGDLSMAVM